MSNELELFLGDKYNPTGKSNRWLYQQMAWEQDKERQGYLAFVRETASARYPSCDVLDCGAGWAGLALADDGFKPSFTASKDGFLQFRLKHRGLGYTIYKIGNESRHTMAVSFDSLLLYKDAWAEIQRLAGLGQIVIFNLHERWPVIEGTFAVNVGGLVEKIKNEFTVLSYKTYNHYAHLFAIHGVERKESKEDGK